MNDSFIFFSQFSDLFQIDSSFNKLTPLLRMFSRHFQSHTQFTETQVETGTQVESEKELPECKLVTDCFTAYYDLLFLLVMICFITVFIACLVRIRCRERENEINS